MYSLSCNSSSRDPASIASRVLPFPCSLVESSSNRPRISYSAFPQIVPRSSLQNYSIYFDTAMLSRGNSDASARLRRAKSTSAVPRIPALRSVASEDRTGTHHNALTAATIAFERAKSINMANEKRPQLSRVNSKRSMMQPRLSGEGSHLSRRSSIIGSTAAPTRSGSTHKKYDQLKSETRKASVAPTPQTPLSEADVFSISSPDQRLAERFDGYGVPFASRLRKARSSQGYQSDDTKISTPPKVTPRRLTVAAPTTRENQTDEAILALARDRYLSEHEIKPLRKRASFFAPLINKTRKSKRASMISDESLSQGKASIEASLMGPTTLEHLPPQLPYAQVAPPEPPLKLQGKSQKGPSSLSSIKRGWNRTFGRSTRSSNGPTAIPPQHVVSQRVHSREVIPRTSVDIQMLNAPFQTFEDRSSSPPPTPPPHLVDVRSSSPRDFDDATHVVEAHQHHPESRVTSWSDSTRRNTIMTNELDTLPLPAIQESPESRQVSVLPGESKDDFRYQGESVPMRRSSSRFNLRGGIDTKRLVSALRRHTKSSAVDTQEPRKISLSSLIRRPSGGNTSVLQREAEEPAVPSTVPGPDHEGSSSRDVFTQSQTEHDSDDVSKARLSSAIYQAREDVISPSVYSDRIESEADTAENLREQSASGMATVLQSGPAARWSLDGGARKKEHKHSTSNEWRMWAHDEISGLEGRSSFSLPAFSAPEVRARDSSVLHSTSSSPVESDRTSSHAPDRSPEPDTPDWIEESPTRVSSTQPSRQHSLLSRRSSKTGPSRRTSATSRTARDPSGSTMIQLESTFEEDADDHPTTLHHREPSNTELLSKYNNDAPSAKEAGSDQKAFRTRSSRLPRLSNLTRRSSIVGKKEAAPGQPLDPRFLQRIVRGPYHASSSTLGGSRENISRMPMGSSSSINLPKRSSAIVGGGSKENTPPSRGQRMADDFLSKRLKDKNGKGKENSSSPAFV